jgi:4-hydroxy-tetrahydrodipicolinate reductase
MTDGAETQRAETQTSETPGAQTRGTQAHGAQAHGAKIRVAVAGASGKMGREIVKAIAQSSEMTLVAAIARRHAGEDAGTVAGLSPLGVPLVSELSAALVQGGIDVLVDVTTPQAAAGHALEALTARVRPVIGTTGLSAHEIQEITHASQTRGLGAILAPNFAIGAILMMKFAKEAALHFANAEILELHHNQKADAPSGTALKTAELMRESRAAFGLDNAHETEKIAGARGAEAPGGIHIHSIRLPGLVAHQEVIFGGLGQTLTIRHDSLSRESFMPGVLFSVRKVMELDHFVYGLEQIL